MQIFENLITSNATFLEDVKLFIDAVEWSKEIWLQFLFSIFIVLALFTWFMRNHVEITCVIFIMSCISIWMAQPLNSLLSRNWESFSSQNYFDASGVFLSIVYSLPLAIIALFSLILLLRQVGQLLVQVKRAQLKKNQ